jgi:hypothetical protein
MSIDSRPSRLPKDHDESDTLLRTHLSRADDGHSLSALDQEAFGRSIALFPNRGDDSNQKAVAQYPAVGSSKNNGSWFTHSIGNIKDCCSKICILLS